MSEKNFKIHSVKYNFLMNVILKTSTFIFPLVTFPYVSRVLGPGPNGDISFAASVISYFSLIAAMGIPSYGVRKCAEYRDNPIELGKVFQELLIINTLFTILSYAVLVLLVQIIPQFKNDSLLIYITSITIIFSTFGVEWVYQAIEQYDYITVRNIAFKIFAVIGMFVFVHKPSDYIVYAGITVFGNVGSNILNILRLPRYIPMKKYKKYNLKMHISPIFLLFLYNATTTIFTNLDQVMLGFMSSNKEVGYYAATVKIKNILTSVITSLGAVMLPRVAYYLGKKDNKAFARLIKKSFDFIFISAIPISLFFLIEAKPIIDFLAGSQYLRATVILQCIAPSIIFIGISSVTAWQLLIPLKLEKYTVLGAIVGAILNVILNIILIPKIGGAGAAIATTIAELSVLITHIIVLRELINENKFIEFIELYKVILASIIATIVILVFNYCVTVANSLLECLLSGIIYFSCYIVVLFIVKNKMIREISKDIITRLG